MRSNPLSAASVGNVRSDTAPHNGSSAEIIDLSEVEAERRRLRKGCARLFSAVFRAESHYQCCVRAAIFSGMSPDTWDRIARQEVKPNSDHIGALKAAARAKGMSEGRFYQILGGAE